MLQKQFKYEKNVAQCETMSYCIYVAKLLQESEETEMFNLDNFLLMLVKNKYTKAKLAQRLGISKTSLYRRLNSAGNFTIQEVRIMIALFGKEDVINALFC